MNFILWGTGTEPEHHLILATLTEAVFDVHFRHENDVGNGDFLSENTSKQLSILLQCIKIATMWSLFKTLISCQFPLDIVN